MSGLNLKKFAKFGERLASGLSILLSQGNAYFLYTPDNWETVVKLLQNFIVIDRTIKTGFELLSSLLIYLEKNQEIEIFYYENMLDVVCIYFKSENLEQYYIGKSIEIVLKIFKAISRYNNDVNCQFWKKIIGELGKLCQNTRHFVRISAYAALQEMVLGFSKQDSWQIWKECFDKVLFPLVIEPFIITKEMLKGASEEKAFQMKQEYISSREKATSLVCYTVLNILQIIASAQDFQLFWLRLVKLLSQTLRQKEDINEQSYELIKNLFLIVKTENIVSEDLWTETWTLVNLEELKTEINSQ